MTRSTVHAVRPDSLEPSTAGVPGMILGGKYRLEEAIARGGTGRVWRATHVTLDRPVAVKFVDSWGADEERIERFLREAKVAASVRHRHVVDILDFGTSPDGEPYMVMELLEGETLDERLARGAIGDEEVVEIVVQILSGLDAVHRAGIVHRDLKPGNVFLSHEGEGEFFARLLDFGISQDVHETESEERVVVGTPEYMSPEQAFGDRLDVRSDLYSVGVVLYEMLSGVLPFEHPDPQEVVEMVAHRMPPSIRALRPDVPRMCAVVERAMQKDPTARFETARAMRAAVLEASGTPVEFTGRYSVIPRDSRSSGTMQRASDAAPMPVRVSPLPPPPSEEFPARPAAARWPWVVLLAVLAACGAAAWALTTRGGLFEASASPEPAALVQGAGDQEPVAEPAVDDVSVGESEGAPDADEPPAAPASLQEPARRRRGLRARANSAETSSAETPTPQAEARAAESPAAPRSPAAEVERPAEPAPIVRELDF